MNTATTLSPAPQAQPWSTEAQPHRGRVAVVTGAARGIGLEIALRLARDGARLALADTDGEQLVASAQAVRAAGAEVITQVGDLSLETTANALMAATLAAFGRIDILVNNAGGGVILPFLEHTPQTLKQTIDRNLWTVLWCC
ncbi:MAG: SDR family NAD(P)-dependent oxidoreductase, partial [Rhodoferax sp.]|uniref:SDR family NAD(P)-dependent oxidoreductase n=1 Tax=Rhodoferax sp. TaxID=50421 RepID=UPI003BB51587